MLFSVTFNVDMRDVRALLPAELLRERCGVDLWTFQALFLFQIGVSVWVLSVFLRAC
jgi:hypothetical protein